MDKTLAEMTHEELSAVSKSLGNRIRELKLEQQVVDALYHEKRETFLADQEIAKHQAAIDQLVAKKAK